MADAGWIQSDAISLLDLWLKELKNYCTTLNVYLLKMFPKLQFIAFCIETHHKHMSVYFIKTKQFVLQ